jgi:hypothetical protein
MANSIATDMAAARARFMKAEGIVDFIRGYNRLQDELINGQPILHDTPLVDEQWRMIALGAKRHFPSSDTQALIRTMLRERSR